ncbi:hypothetical protein Bca101_022553 [Brassica carinata]
MNAADVADQVLRQVDKLVRDNNHAGVHEILSVRGEDESVDGEFLQSVYAFSLVTMLLTVG